jgi:thiosulfate reductase cytochrome b subunit
MARWFHFWITMSFLGFFAVHIVQVILAGWNNFRAMVSGKEIQPVVVPSVEGERRSWR